MPTRQTNRFFLIGTLLAIVLLSGGCFGSRGLNPFRGLFRLSLEEERELGRLFLLEIEKKKWLTRDPYIQQYIEDIGQRIVTQIGPQPFRYNFYVLNNPNINAFAAPAGHIFIYSGLINMLDNESELAGVLSHEIGHVTARHIAQQIEKARKLSLPTLAAVLAGVMAGGSGEATEAIIAGTLAGQTSLMLKFSREDEEESDRLGFSYLTRAGYDPCGMVSFLFKLMKEYGIRSSRLAPYQSTHPEIIQRIAYLENMISPSRQCWGRGREEGIFKRIQARLLIESRGAQSAIKYLNQQLKEDPEDLDSSYGLALAYQRAGKVREAIEVFKIIIDRRPEDAEFKRDLGILYFYAGRLAEAGAVLEEAAAARPEDIICLYHLGRTYQKKGDLDRAIRAYQQVIGQAPKFAPAYYALGLIYGKRGLNAQSHANLGIFFELRGERGKALFHFKKARKLYGKESKEAERIEKRIKALISRGGIVDYPK